MIKPIVNPFLGVMVLNFLQIVKPSEQIHRFPRAHHTVEWQADTLKCCYLGQRHILAQRAWQRPFEYHAEWRILMDYNVFQEYEKHPHSNWSQICRFIPPAGFWVVFSGRTIFPVRSRWGRYILPTQYIYIYSYYYFPYTHFWIGRNQWNMAMSQNPTQVVPK